MPILTVRVFGAGYVTSNPTSIYCGSACVSAYSPLDGTAVTLTATPAGSTFTGWAGACSGTGSCNLTMKSTYQVIATF